MAIKKMNITHEQHDEFVKQHPNGDMLQLTKWAESKKLTGWYSRRIAVGDGETLTGVAQMLFKKVPKLPYTLCYISRGFVVDYKEDYGDIEGVGTFHLIIKQKKDKMSQIAIEGGYSL